jgi:hypothetical protein
MSLDILTSMLENVKMIHSKNDNANIILPIKNSLEFLSPPHTKENKKKKKCLSCE